MQPLEERYLNEDQKREQMVRLLNDVLNRQGGSEGVMQAVTINGSTKAVDWEVGLDEGTREYTIRMSDNDGNDIFVNVSADGEEGSITSMFGNIDFFKDLISPQDKFWEVQGLIDMKKDLSKGVGESMDDSAERFALRGLANETIQMLLVQMDVAPEEYLEEILTRAESTHLQVIEAVEYPEETIEAVMEADDGQQNVVYLNRYTGLQPRNEATG